MYVECIRTYLRVVWIWYDIFKIPDERTRKPFVSDRFKKTVEDNGLQGFKFELVWDSEAVQEPEEIEEISNTTPQKTEIEGDFFTADPTARSFCFGLVFLELLCLMEKAQ